MSDPRSPDDDEGGGSRGTIAAAIVVAVLILGGWWLMNELQHHRDVQNCIEFRTARLYSHRARQIA